MNIESSVRKIVCIPASDEGMSTASFVEVLNAENIAQAVRLWQKGEGDDLSLYCQPQTSEEILQLAAVFDHLPNGVAILDQDNKITKANQRLINWFPGQKMIGLNFYEGINNPTIIGPELSPLTTIVARKVPCSTSIQISDRFFNLHAVPMLDAKGQCRYRLVVLTDTTEVVNERQKLKALHQAGAALADISPDEVCEMDFVQRTELLKENILHYTKDLLNFDVVEIRLLREENRLETLLSVGIEESQAKLPLYACELGNGVTGFVAATGKSYSCDDTTNDPLYVRGLVGAKSSLTVPLIYHDEVIGTFNVESVKTSAFSENDLRFLETFAADVAVALNTLDLLSAQQTNTAMQSVEAIHASVVIPIDEILNDAVNAIDAYQGSNQEMIKKLQSILNHAREIKLVINRVGEQMAACGRNPIASQAEERPKLRGKRILVIDENEDIRISAHNLLERFGCIVETAHAGHEAMLMIRNSGMTTAYDTIVADIRLPDIKGYELMTQLKCIVEDPPLILMTGYGYDPGHSIVKARQAGLKPNALVFKPFRLKQLLDAIESIIS